MLAFQAPTVHHAAGTLDDAQLFLQRDASWVRTKEVKAPTEKREEQKEKKSLTCSLHLFTMREFYCWTDKRKEVEGLVDNESPDLICISAILMRRMSPAWQCPDLVPQTVSGGWGRLEEAGGRRQDGYIQYTDYLLKRVRDATVIF